VSHNSNHAEAFNNLGVLELRKGNVDQARSNFQQSSKASTFLFEPAYNIAYLFYKKGEFQ
jgi:tetratricopeptide repeat protein 8